MDTASLELCRELFELSGWEGEDCYQLIELLNPDTGKVIKRNPGINSNRQHIVSYGVSGGYVNDKNRGERRITPLYDSGYLLRRLPRKSIMFDHPLSLRFNKLNIYCGYSGWYAGYADTPENAACKLAIELFKQNILKK